MARSKSSIDNEVRRIIVRLIRQFTLLVFFSCVLIIHPSVSSIACIRACPSKRMTYAALGPFFDYVFTIVLIIKSTQAQLRLLLSRTFHFDFVIIVPNANNNGGGDVLIQVEEFV